MKKIFLIITIFISSYIITQAQEGGRLEAYKIAYLTKKLNLSPEEAQRFWPIYNKYENEIRSARLENRRNKENVIENDEKILNIRKKYNVEFSKALSTEKVNTLFRSEKEFGTIVQRELQDRMQNQQDQNRKRNKQ